MVKALPANAGDAGDLGSIPESTRPFADTVTNTRLPDTHTHTHTHTPRRFLGAFPPWRSGHTSIEGAVQGPGSGARSPCPVSGSPALREPGQTPPGTQPSPHATSPNHAKKKGNEAASGRGGSGKCSPTPGRLWLTARTLGDLVHQLPAGFVDPTAARTS